MSRNVHSFLLGGVVPKVTEQYREAKREEIADAALRCFSKKGFGASMADIIAEAGLSAGAIYGHFASKHEVMLSVAGRVMGNRVDELRALQSVEPVPSPGDAVARVLRGLASDVSNTGLLLQTWGGSVTDPGIRGIVDEVFAELRSAYVPLFAAWARQNRGLDEAEARDWASALIPISLALGQGYIVQSALFLNFDAEAYFASVRELLPH
jgi:AcrR family transcriptional regulator